MNFLHFPCTRDICVAGGQWKQIFWLQGLLCSDYEWCALEMQACFVKNTQANCPFDHGSITFSCSYGHHWILTTWVVSFLSHRTPQMIEWKGHQLSNSQWRSSTYFTKFQTTCMILAQSIENARCVDARHFLTNKNNCLNSAIFVRTWQLIWRKVHM